MVLSGCAESSALIKANSTSLRTDVYEELTNGATAPQGYVDLRVTATLKTHNRVSIPLRIFTGRQITSCC